MNPVQALRNQIQPTSDPRVGMTALMLATAVFLAVNTPQVDDTSGNVLTGGPAAMVERIAEWRPQGPPPWAEMDQAASEDVEPARTRSADDAQRSRRTSSDIRSRTQR